MIAFQRIGLFCLLFISMPMILAAQGRNSIEGRIVDPTGKGIADARISLKNQNYTEVGQDIADSMGNFRLSSVSDGVYYIEVDPVGTAYERQSRRIQLVSLSLRGGGSAETYHFDFELHPLRQMEKPLPKKLADFLTFVQSVPPAALQKYKEAQKLLEKKKNDEAYALLREAIETFPDYYDALDLLGTEYLKAGWFDVAVPLFLQAVDVNAKGWHSFFGLGAGYSGLKMSKQSIAALRKATDLNPLHTKTLLLLGSQLAKSKGTQEEAVKTLEKIIKLDSSDMSEAYVALASIYSTLERYTLAADALDAYLKITPEVKNSDAISQKSRELRKKAQGRN